METKKLKGGKIDAHDLMQDYWERIGMSESRKTHLDKYKIIMICTLSVVSQPVLVENPTV